MAADITTALDLLLDCVCDALSERGRGACRCGVTIGPPVIAPGACDCDCDGDGVGGQVSGHLERFYPADNLTRTTRVESCRPGGAAADYTLVLTRCYPTLDEAGNVPTVDDTRPYAEDLHTDAQIVWTALRCCTGLKLLIRDMAVDAVPQAGCSALAVRVTVEVTPTAPPLVIGS